MPQNRSPLGPSQELILSFMLKNPGSTAQQIREGVFNDKTSKYVSNLLWELTKLNYVRYEKSYSSDVPTTWWANINELVKVINIPYFAQTGVFIGTKVR